MIRVIIGLVVATVVLIALCTFLVSLYQSKKEKRLAQAQEKEKRESLGEALYDACHEMSAAADDIRKFCTLREFGEWDSIGSSLLHITSVLDKTNQFIATHPKHAGHMHDVVEHLLPLTKKMMSEYDLCTAHGANNTAAKENLKIINNCLREVGAALNKKLDALFEGRTYDLQAELFVLESRKEEQWKLS